MINRGMQLFSLQQKVLNYGVGGDTWEPIEETEVNVFSEKLEKVVGEQTFITHQPMGLTRFDGFEKKYEYRIVNDISEYLIMSFITSARYSQLVLKEVIAIE